jgi:hypothetical protein
MLKGGFRRLAIRCKRLASTFPPVRENSLLLDTLEDIETTLLLGFLKSDVPGAVFLSLDFQSVSQ